MSSPFQEWGTKILALQWHDVALGFPMLLGLDLQLSLSPTRTVIGYNLLSDSQQRLQIEG